jgi:hypothetical protein
VLQFASVQAHDVAGDVPLFETSVYMFFNGEKFASLKKMKYLCGQYIKRYEYDSIRD